MMWRIMRHGENSFWFKPYTYGIGATPKTWEGWALIGAYVLAVSGLVVLLQDESPVSLLLCIMLLTAALAFIAWRKTEGGWRWRWGDPAS
jgi:hypothetical protein